MQQVKRFKEGVPSTEQKHSLPVFVLRLLTEFLPSGRELTLILHHICKQWSRVPAQLFERQWQQRTWREFAIDRLSQPTWAAEYKWQAQVDSNWLRGRYHYSRTDMPAGVEIYRMACSDTHIVLANVQDGRGQLDVYSLRGLQPEKERRLDIPFKGDMYNFRLAIDKSSTWIYVGRDSTLYCISREAGKVLNIEFHASIVAMEGNCYANLMVVLVRRGRLFVISTDSWTVERIVDLSNGYPMSLAVDWHRKQAYASGERTVQCNISPQQEGDVIETIAPFANSKLSFCPREGLCVQAFSQYLRATEFYDPVTMTAKRCKVSDSERGLYLLRHVKHGPVDVQWTHGEKCARLVEFATGRQCGTLQHWTDSTCALSRSTLVQVSEIGTCVHCYTFAPAPFSFSA
jgi:hypothetical protein